MFDFRRFFIKSDYVETDEDKTYLVDKCRDLNRMIDKVNLKSLPWPMWIKIDFCPFQSLVDNLLASFSSATMRCENCQRTRGQQCNFACSSGWTKPMVCTLDKQEKR